MSTQDEAPGRSASSRGHSRVLSRGGFPPHGTQMALGVPACQLRLKDGPPPGEERDVAVISPLGIGIIIFTSPNPFSVFLNTSSF